MTFNVGYFICAVLGLSVGYFVFGRKRQMLGAENDATDCCHSVA